MRAVLMNAALQRAEFDRTHSKDICKQHYAADLTGYPQEFADKFVQLNQDDGANEFLNLSYQKSDWIFTQIFHLVSARLLSFFMTKTSINGLLGRGSMFIFSTAQFQKLLRVDGSWKGHAMLDIGAGDGHVTDQMAPLFDHIYVTEKSAPMTWRLYRKAKYQ